MKDEARIFRNCALIAEKGVRHGQTLQAQAARAYFRKGLAVLRRFAR